MSKRSIAVYWAAACGGCDVAVLDLHERVLDLAAVADIELWPIAMDFKVADIEALPFGHLDACLFSGAIRNSENAAMARLLRGKSRTMVALGSCAHLGGIPGLANLASRRDLLSCVYRDTRSTSNPEGTFPLEHVTTPLGELELPAVERQLRALDQVVDVDLSIPGCPPPAERLWEALSAIIDGELPAPGSVVGATDTALCDECPRSKGEKRLSSFRSIATFIPDPEICLLEQGVVCCGPATRGGCSASCLAANMPCRGCSGPPPGVSDQGGKLLSAVASIIDSEDPAEIDRIVDQIEDPAGSFYRFSLASSLLPAAHRGESP